MLLFGLVTATIKKRYFGKLIYLLFLSLSKQIILTTSPRELRPYGQPGQMPIGNLVALLIELKAQIL
jgi:hypothetical protein